jgi:nitrous oxidase accessory protein NosD
MSQAGKARLMLQWLEAREVPAVLYVDDTPGKHVDYTSIQAAVDAAHAGDTILVAPGTYEEQVTIGADKDDLTLRSRAPHKAVIQAPDTFESPNALVHVNGADGVVLDGFTITGPSPDLDFGVLVGDKGSAVVRDNLISDIRQDPLGGVQTGIGIRVDTGASVLALDNTIVRYQKGGIAALDDGTRLFASGNKIEGAGPTDVIAQNGIQVAVGAEAVVSRNTISGNEYTGDGADAAGVIAFQAGRMVVADNRLTRNEVGVIGLDQTERLTIIGNDIRDSALDGISLDTAAGAVVAGNRVDDSGRDGIRLEDTTGTLVLLNQVKDSEEYGIGVVGESKGNTIALNSARGSGLFDGFDDTTGDGTAGTANTWVLNRLGTTSPDGLG